ncbi:MAG: MFS transporter, partial [Planctomycetaceae bacterium]|nr:MFS transporter [Planctomycetaceae bacterium]
GTTSHWATRDLMGVLIGAVGPIGMIYLWANPIAWPIRIIGSILGLVIAAVGYTYPVMRYIKRSGDGEVIRGAQGYSVQRLMILGAILGGVALLGTWGGMQWAAPWADKLTGGTNPNAKAFTQIALGLGAIVGTIAAAVIGHNFGRRITYFGLCVLSLATTLLFFLSNTAYNTSFLLTGFLAGTMAASFFGWLPLYLPELFPTRVRATGQGFAFNFGRILAAAGSLQTGALMQYFEANYDKSYPYACSVMSCIYIVGMIAIWFVPETHGQEMPE